MYHTSAKLTLGGGEKIFEGKKTPGGAKKLQGRKKPIRKTEKIVATFFFFFFSFFFEETVKNLYFVGAPKISARGRRMVNMVNVTPLGSIWEYGYKGTGFLYDDWDSKVHGLDMGIGILRFGYGNRDTMGKGLDNGYGYHKTRYTQNVNRSHPILLLVCRLSFARTTEILNNSKCNCYSVDCRYGNE